MKRRWIPCSAAAADYLYTVVQLIRMNTHVRALLPVLGALVFCLPRVTAGSNHGSSSRSSSTSRGRSAGPDRAVRRVRPAVAPRSAAAGVRARCSPSAGCAGDLAARHGHRGRRWALRGPREASGTAGLSRSRHHPLAGVGYLVASGRRANWVRSDAVPRSGQQIRLPTFVTAPVWSRA